MGLRSTFIIWYRGYLPLRCARGGGGYAVGVSQNESTRQVLAKLLQMATRSEVLFLVLHGKLQEYVFEVFRRSSEVHEVSTTSLINFWVQATVPF